jgi:hypothetical protein
MQREKKGRSTRARIVILLWILAGAGAIGTGRELIYNVWYLLTAL